jgi:hypothetical protein
MGAGFTQGHKRKGKKEKEKISVGWLIRLIKKRWINSS